MIPAPYYKSGNEGQKKLLSTNGIPVNGLIRCPGSSLPMLRR